MQKLFAQIDDKLFSVLAAPNRELYFECLLCIYKQVEYLDTMGENKKDKIIEYIKKLLDDRVNVEILEDDADNLINNREKATYLVNHLKNCGWYFEEDLGYNNYSINFHDHSIKILNVLKEINDNVRLEYSGYISSIYSMVKDIENIQDASLIEQIHRQTEDLMTKLKSLRSNIYNYYKDVIKDTDIKSAKQILEDFVEKYKKYFFDTAFYNLKTKDAPTRYKDEIIKTITKILRNDELLKNLANKRINETFRTHDEAYQDIADKLLFVHESFESVPRLVQSIDDKNAKYINAVISKAMFFMNRSDDFEGVFNRLVEFVNEDQLDSRELFDIFDTKKIDNSSLFKPRERQRIDMSESPISDIIFDSELEKQKINEILKNKEFSFTAINKHAMQLLIGREQINVSEIKINDYMAYLKILLIYIYSKTSGVDYDIKLKDDFISVNEKIRMRNFIILKR